MNMPLHWCSNSEEKIAIMSSRSEKGKLQYLGYHLVSGFFLHRISTWVGSGKHSNGGDRVWLLREGLTSVMVCIIDADSEKLVSNRVRVLSPALNYVLLMPTTLLSRTLSSFHSLRRTYTFSLVLPLLARLRCSLTVSSNAFAHR